MTSELIEHLNLISACEESHVFAAGRTAQRAWNECKRAYWLLWWAARTDVNPPTAVVLAACDCVRIALQHTFVEEKRLLVTLEAVERWANQPTTKNKAAIGDVGIRDALLHSACIRELFWAIEALTRLAYSAEPHLRATWGSSVALWGLWAIQTSNYTLNLNTQKAANSKMCELIRARLVCPMPIKKKARKHANRTN